jgi:acetyl-CoA acetyltransferase
MPSTYIYDAVRTPFGHAGGALAAVRPDDLAAVVMRAVVDRVGADPALVDEVIFGDANQAGEDNRNVARFGALLAGFPTTVSGYDSEPTVRVLDRSGHPRLSGD